MLHSDPEIKTQEAGDSGTPPKNPPAPCVACTVQIEHPWHDNGSEAHIEHWYKDGAHGTPVFFKKENGYQ